MKMMLSMPSTSSSAVRVAKAIQACGSVKQFDHRGLGSMGGAVVW